MFRRAKSADAGEQLLSGDRRRRRRGETNDRGGAPDPAGTGGRQFDEGAEPAGTAGPWDVSDVTPQHRDQLLDVGSLLLPVVDGMEIQLQVNSDSQEVLGVLAVFGDDAVEVRAFAAPRSSGLWDEVRREVAAETTRHGGVASEKPGPFGTELVLTVATRDERGRPANQRQRMWGIDGPRWMLRAAVVGAVAVAEGAERDARLRPLLEFVRGVVVVRGKAPMAPRDPLPLTMPVEPTDDAEPAGPAGPAGDGEPGGADWT
jgi:hypothetical protein